jgi:class 3 adenylate cyclase
MLASAATVRRAGDEAAAWRAHESVRLRGKTHDTLLFTVSGVS